MDINYDKNVKDYQNNKLVIKFGGSCMDDDKSVMALLKQIIFLNSKGYKIILIHGGGPEISSLSKKLGIENTFIDGLRVTSRETLDVVKMVLIGRVNKKLVSMTNSIGGIAVGLSGIDGNLLLCTRQNICKDTNGKLNIIDAGFVGKIEKVNTEMLDLLLLNNIIPIIAPVGIGEDGQNYNINGDDAASAIAVAIGAKSLIIASNIEGVLKSSEDGTTVIKELNGQEAQKMIETGEIYGGMIPKIKSSLNALKNGVRCVHILNAGEDKLIRNVFEQEMTGTMINQGNLLKESC